MLKIIRGAGARPVRAAAVVLALATLAPGPPAASTVPLAAGMLPVGTHPLEVFATGETSVYANVNDPAPHVVVTNSGGGVTGGWQRQTYHLSPGEIEWVLLAANEPAVRPQGTFVSEIYIEGIYWDLRSAPALWREVNAAGIVVPESPWSWTRTSSNGGVTLRQTSVARVPHTEMVDGVPVVVQRIDTSLTFSGNATGTVTMTHWQEVGNNARVRQRLQGALTVFGSPATVNTVVVLGDLGGLPD